MSQDGGRLRICFGKANEADISMSNAEMPLRCQQEDEEDAVSQISSGRGYCLKCAAAKSQDSSKGFLQTTQERNC